MRLRILVCLLISKLAALGGFQAAEARHSAPEGEGIKIPYVVFIHYGPANDYWNSLVRSFTQTVAADLGMRIEFHYPNKGRQGNIVAIQEVLHSKDKPDYIMFQNFQGTAVDMIRLTDVAGIHSVLLLSGLSDEEEEIIGPPGAKWPYWLGQFLPDDESAGYHLGAALIDSARKAGHSNVEVLALKAGSRNEVSRLQSSGLARALSERFYAGLAQEVSARGQRPIAETKVRILLKRHPKTRVIWAANDNMALGALDYLKSENDVKYIGGMGWLPEMVRAISDGQIAVSMGGQFMDGGWVLTLLYDHFNGKNTIDILKTKKFVSRLAAMTPENVSIIQECSRQEYWEKVDFQKFTKTHNEGWSADWYGPDLICPHAEPVRELPMAEKQEAQD